MSDAGALETAAASLLNDQVDEELVVGDDGELRFQRCDTCGYLRFPAGPRCPQCLGAASTGETDTGLGTIWSFCVYHRGFDPTFGPALPYNVALVELDSGPRLVSNVLGVSNEDLRVGMPVRARAREVAPGRRLIYFEPNPEWTQETEEEEVT